MIDPPPALEVRNLRMTYPRRGSDPERCALDGIDLSIPVGQMVALLGPNGSGKSTIIRIVAGSLEPSTGRTAVFGRSEPSARRRLISVVFQRSGLDPLLTVRENLLFQAALYGMRGRAVRERIDEEIDRFGLGDRRTSLVKSLSVGLARRVDLCRAMLHRPQFLLLDEPTAGLDPPSREWFLSMLDERRRSDGVTILLSTHLVDEAERCDRVLLVNQGRIVADDAPDALRAALGERLLSATGEQPPDGTLMWQRRRGRWVAAVPDVVDVEPEISELIRRGRSFTIAPPTLDDAFEALTGANLEHDADRPLESPT